MNKNHSFDTQAAEDRILQRLSRFTGRPVSETDPALRLLAHWQASELAKLEKAIQDSTRQMVAQVADRLIPAMARTPRPACTVIQVFPSEGTPKTDLADGFCPVESAGNWHFSPLCETALVPATLRYVVHKGEVFKTESVVFKSLFAENADQGNDLWLGIAVSFEAMPDTLVFFIDGASGEGAYSWHELLAHAEWESSSGQTLKAVVGISTRPVASGQPLNLNDLVERDIFNWSKGYFLQLQLVHKQPWDMRCTNPPPFIAVSLSGADGATTQPIEQIMWLRAKLRLKPSDTDVATLRIGLNCIPVLNRQKQVIFFEPTEGNMTIPLRKVEGHPEKHKQEARFYSLDKMQIGPADIPSAAQRQALTDTYYALEYGALEKNTSEGHYVHLHCKEKKERGQISYWSTYTGSEKDLPMGTLLDIAIQSGFHSGFNTHRGQIGQALTVLPLWGQQACPDEAQCRQLLRMAAWQGLTSTPSREYLRACAFARLGNRLKAVVFMPKWAPEPFPAQGVRRVLEMALIPDPEAKDQVCWELERVLLEQNIADLPGMAAPFVQVTIQALTH